jgi:16S rRNA (cytosine967-C5)-methyltransferase
LGIANPGRVAAVRALIEVEKGGHVEEALARVAPPSPQDRRLAWFVALGVLRKRAHVDAALRPFLQRPLASLDAPVRAVLRAGAFEKLYARTPAHAVVHQTVEVAAIVGAKRATGLVNAVLRRVSEPTGLSRAEELDHPDWLVERWTARYGVEATDAWCRKNGEPPPLIVVANGDAEALATAFREQGLTVAEVALRGKVLPDVLRVDGLEGAVTQLPGFEEGRFWVMDAASVAVADLVGPREGLRVLDACAAPGGKAFRLAARGATVLATDREARLQPLIESAKRLSLPVAWKAWDWTQGPLPGAPSFDVVFVDAPCTGLGTVRRHPEVRWRRQPQDVLAMPATQGPILAAAATHVAAGGALVYAVCSPEPEEGPQVVQTFLSANPGFTLAAEVATAPPEGDEDAFYGARMVRS